MDEVDAAEAALLSRFFPNASQVATGLFPQGPPTSRLRFKSQI
jgi:hypothetical protein